MLERVWHFFERFLAIVFPCGILLNELDLPALVEHRFLRVGAGALDIKEQETFFLHQLLRKLSQFPGNSFAAEVLVHGEDKQLRAD